MRTKFTNTINIINRKIAKINHQLDVNYFNLASEQWESWCKDTVRAINKLEAEKHDLMKDLDRFEKLHLKELM